MTNYLTDSLFDRHTPPRPPVDNTELAIEYPETSYAPINEFVTEGYIAMAFPTLFPYGTCDLRDNSSRRTNVTASEYFKHLMRYKDGRFGRDPR